MQVQMMIYYLNFVYNLWIRFYVCLYLLPPHTIQVHFIFFIQCSLIFPFDPLLGHDFLHVYKIGS